MELIDAKYASGIFFILISIIGIIVVCFLLFIISSIMKCYFWNKLNIGKEKN